MRSINYIVFKMRQQLSMISGAKYLRVGVLKLFMVAKNYLPVHKYTNNEGRVIAILGTQLRCYIFDCGVKILQTKHTY